VARKSGSAKQYPSRWSAEIGLPIAPSLFAITRSAGDRSLAIYWVMIAIGAALMLGAVVNSYGDSETVDRVGLAGGKPKPLDKIAWATPVVQ
jgi:hypothetical protein